MHGADRLGSDAMDNYLRMQPRAYAHVALEVCKENSPYHAGEARRARRFFAYALRGILNEGVER